MELLILTLEDRNNNRGEYLPNKIIEPVKIEDNFYILNRSLSDAKGLEDYKEAILVHPYFVIGDESEYDLKYQQYLIDSQELI